jgi:hypothetical protein
MMKSAVGILTTAYEIVFKINTTEKNETPKSVSHFFLSLNLALFSGSGEYGGSAQKRKTNKSPYF